MFRHVMAASTLAAPALPISAIVQTPSAVAKPVAFDQAAAHAAVTRLADALAANFVLPEKGDRYAAALRAKLAAGGYDHFPDAASFTAQVTADLHAVYADRHLRLFAPNSGGPHGPRGAPAQSIARAGSIVPGVAYIDFEVFDGSDETLAKLAKFMAEHATAKTLIIDARDHHGGGIAEMDVMFPYLYAERTPLLTFDTRQAVVEARGDPFADTPSMMAKTGAPAGVMRREHYALPGAVTALRTATVYLLTSSHTASAAEHMALALKRTHRATLIGETTAGAGNYGDFIPVGDGYRAFVPMGRTFDPDTNRGWEGTGVTPDIAVAGDAALDVALDKAGVKARAAQAFAGLS